MSLSRLTLPENFYDTTSAMLLRAPEPQYMFAMLYKAALSAELQRGTGIGLPGRQAGSSGAPYRSAEADRFDLGNEGMAILTRMFAAKVEFGGQPGHTVRFNRPKFADSTYTLASRRVAQNATISVVPIEIGSEQKPITLGRFAGPYDNANSRVAPFAVDKFDSTLGVHQAGSIVGEQLQRDYDRWIEAVFVTLLDTASTIVRPQGMTTDDTPAAATSAPFDYDTLNRAEKAADEANVPYFPDGHRVSVITPAQANALKSDPLYARYSEFHPSMNALFPGYLKTVNKIHVFKSNMLTTSNNANSISVHRGMLFGPDLMGIGAGQGGPNNNAPAWVAASTDDNYGETPKVIWLTYAAFELFDNRFCVSMRTTAGA